jgi:hypothetical protein
MGNSMWVAKSQSISLFTTYSLSPEKDLNPVTHKNIVL